MLARMKQRASSNNNNGGYSDFSEKEYEIADILIQLPQLILNSELNYLVQLSWGTKRRRTAIFGTPSTSAISPSPSTNLSHQYNHNQSLPPPPSSEVDAISSPNTPLSFLPQSDSDSKPSKSLKRKLPKKKTIEEWKDILSEVKDRNHTYKKEVETVMKHFNTLKAQNLRLKSILSKKSNGLQELDLFVEEPITAPEQHQQQVLGVGVERRFFYQQQETPFQFIDLKPHFGSDSSAYLHPQITMRQQHMGPSGIPDLNFVVANHDEHDMMGDDIRYNNNIMGGIYQPFDDDLRKRVLTSAASSAARRRRIEVTKVKKSAKPSLQIRL
ncbi:hypothetical protein MKX01_039071 [Papaver californicum]|nr:hypothetical protein MKX01_039071 [Papaver californicum]